MTTEMILAIAIASAPASAALDDGHPGALQDVSPAGHNPVRVEALVAEAYDNHPRLEAVHYRAEAADQVPSRAGAMPDPWLGIAGQNLRIDSPLLRSAAMSSVQVGVLQAIPFPGKLRRRKAVAQARADTLDRVSGLVMTEVALGVRRAYWELHFAERAVEITEQSEQVFDTLVDVAIERYAVGLAAQQDSLQAEVAHSRLRADLTRRRQAVQTGRRIVNSAVGRDPTDELGPTAVPPDEPVPAREKLRARADTDNPAVLVRRAALLTADRTVAEARRDRLPDFQLGASWRFRAAVEGDPTDGRDMFMLGVAMSLPVWAGRKQSARVRELVLGRSAAAAEVEATKLDVVTELERLVDIIERLEPQIRIYDEEVIPQATGALDASLADYQFGRVGFVSILQNWETELDVQLARERLVTERAVRRAELRALTGE